MRSLKRETGATIAGGERLRWVESRQNSQVKELRRGFAQSELVSDGLCAIEGMRILEEAIRSGLRFSAVFFSASAESRASKLLPQLAAEVDTLLLPDEIFREVVPSETPQGVAGLVKVKQFSVDDVLGRIHDGPLLAIAGLQDPGNLGTILRSAEAFGAGGVLLGEGTVSQFNSKAVRASAGSVFRLPTARAKLAEALARLHELGAKTVATSSHNGVALHEADLSGPTAIFIGSEGAGLPRELLKAVKLTVVIPHSTSVESLNAGVAASILLYEVARQRNAGSPRRH